MLWCLALSLFLSAPQELDLLRSLSFDSNVVQFYGAAVLEGCPVLVLECMEVRSQTAVLFHAQGINLLHSEMSTG